MYQDFATDADSNRDLVEAVRDLALGEDQTDIIFEKIEERERIYGEMRRLFNVTVSGEKEDVKEFCRDAIQSADRYFEEYFQILDEIRAQARDFNENKLVESARKLEETYHNLSMAFLIFHNDAMIARGPSSHGGMNTIINSLLRIQHGEQIQEQLKKEIEMELFMGEQALIALEAVEDNFFNGQLRKFYEDYLSVLKNFDEYFETGDNEILNGFLDELEAIGIDYKAVDVYYQSRALSQGPTRLPMLNLALNCAENFIKNECPEELFQYYLSELDQLYGGVRYRYECILATNEPGDESQVYEIEKLDRAMEDVADCLEGLYKILETRDENVFAGCREVIIKASDNVADAVDNFRRLAEEGKKLKCFRCGFENPPGRITCNNCNALLPVVEQKES